MKKDKKDNILVNILLLILFILITYYAIVMPQDFPVHMELLRNWIVGIIVK